MKRPTLGWLHIREYQYPETGNELVELVDIPAQDQVVVFKRPEDKTNKKYVRVVVIPVDEV